MALGTTGQRLRAVTWPHANIRLLVGMLLVVVALVGGLSLWSQMRVTVPIIVAARALPAGHVIAAEDLVAVEARLEGPLASLAIGEADRSSVIGQTVAAPIAAGAMVVRPGLGTGPTIGQDEVAVTVPVPADTVFARLRRGDQVAVLATSEKGRPQSLTSVLLERVTVYDVSLDASRVTLGGGSQSSSSQGDVGRITNVTILVPRAQAEAVTNSLVNGTLTIALVAPNAQS